MGKAKGHYFYPGQPCHFMAEGEGCEIYEDRPKLCRMFECVWLTDPTVPEELWPGHSHFIIVPGPELVPQHGYEVLEEHRALFDEWLSNRPTH